jgi:hypothetical protein
VITGHQEHPSAVETPRIVQLSDGLEVLAYERPDGFRVDSWKSFHVE